MREREGEGGRGREREGEGGRGRESEGEEQGTGGCEEGKRYRKGGGGGGDVAGRRENIQSTNTPKISGEVTGRNLFS